MTNKRFVSLLLVIFIISSILTGCFDNYSQEKKPEKDNMDKKIEQRDESKKEEVKKKQEDKDKKAEQKKQNSEENTEEKIEKNISKEEIEELYKEDKEMLDYIKQFVGKPAPNFKMVNKDGKEVSLNDFKGKNIIIEFMGSWCPVCSDTSIIIDEFNQKSKNAKIISVAINDNKESLNTFLSETEVKNTEHYIATNPESLDDSYSLRFVPIFFYIDKEGYIQMILGGSIPIEILEEFAEKSFK